jgi:hypothetical protein
MAVNSSDNESLITSESILQEAFATHNQLLVSNPIGRILRVLGEEITLQLGGYESLLSQLQSLDQ